MPPFIILTNSAQLIERGSARFFPGFDGPRMAVRMSPEGLGGVGLLFTWHDPRNRPSTICTGIGSAPHRLADGYLEVAVDTGLMASAERGLSGVTHAQHHGRDACIEGPTCSTDR